LSLAVGSLVYFAAGRHLYRERPRGLARAPLLGVQVMLMLAGNAVLLLDPALFALVRSPGAVPASVADADGLMGWLTLGLSALAVLAHLGLTHWHEGVRVPGSLGVAAGVLLACTAAHFDAGDWLSYHPLTMAWAGLATLFLAVGWREDRRRWWAA